MTTYDALTTAELARRLAAPGCLVLPVVSSTMDVVHDLAAEGAPAGTVVLADEQRSGRGRQGRRWYSPAGIGVWLGYLVRPQAALENGVMAVRVGLAVAEVLEELGVAAQLKWPNDVVVRERKLGGILCEARRGRSGQWIAVGVGINVHRPLPDELAHKAIALDEMRDDVTRVDVLERLVPKLRRLPDAPTLSAQECTRFRERDWLRGRPVREPVAGVVDGLDADGALLVRTAAGVARVVGGSVVAA